MRHSNGWRTIAGALDIELVLAHDLLPEGFLLAGTVRAPPRAKHSGVTRSELLAQLECALARVSSNGWRLALALEPVSAEAAA
eukprot:scaffold261371_cov33-Tisochrysis_lutea.AAC.2